MAPAGCSAARRPEDGADQEALLRDLQERASGARPVRRRLVVASVLLALLVGAAVAVASAQAPACIASAGRLVGLEADADPKFDDDFWRSVKKHGDLDNVMPLAEAEKLDKQAEERAKSDKLGELPPMKFLLYPALTEAHDKHIASKLKGLTRDSQIVLPDGTKIPYWHTLQYVNRNMRFFFTRFRESRDDKKDIMDQTDQTIAWEWSMLLRKVLVTDCVKSYIDNDPKYPKQKYSGLHKGEKMSGPIFWRHMEADRRAAFLRMGELRKASAVATGPGITVNNNKMFKERSATQTMALLAHEHSHNMGYHHKDRAPGGIQKAVTHCARKKAYGYTTVDLAQPAFQDFNVQK